MENGGTAMNILEMMGNLGKLERLNHETCGNANIQNIWKKSWFPDENELHLVDVPY